MKLATIMVALAAVLVGDLSCETGSCAYKPRATLSP
jgi:hypothetical protein